MPDRNGFTLIELLVVVTIIVVLLALLTPALDKAIYQTELTVCGANLHAVGTGVTAYAVDFKKQYPYRAPMDKASTSPRRSGAIVAEYRASNLYFDDRPIIRGHIDINGHLQCPLAKKVDLTTPYTLSTSDTYVNGGVYSNYGLWYGWRFQGYQGMRKIGDRLEWEDAKGRHYFGVLAADLDMTHTYMQASHPDKRGVLANAWNQDEVIDGGDAGGVEAGTAKMTLSFWQANGTSRGGIDRNFVYHDSSVRRIDDVMVDDPRMVQVPERSNLSDWQTGMRTQLPER